MNFVIRSRWDDNFVQYIEVEDHEDRLYNDQFFRKGYWNGEPHFETGVGVHLFKSLGDRGITLDDRS